MEVRPESEIADLISSIEENQRIQIEHDRERAMRFPESTEDYLALPLENRMLLAADILGTYYPFLSFERFDESIAAEGKYAEARVATDQPGFVINGKVSYYRGDTEPRTRRYRPEAIYVWGQAENTLDDSHSASKILGKIEVGRDTVRGSEPHDYLSMFDLDDPRAVEMIELIDDAIGGLINGVIATHRNTSLGRQALQGSAS